MKTLINPHATHRQSTYQLLVQSEEKKRSGFEALAYFLLIAATSASIWQFSHQVVTFTGIGAAAAAQQVAALQSPAVRG